MAEKIIALRLEVDGVSIAINDQRELRDELKKTRRELRNTDDPRAYAQLEKRLEVLKQLQRENRKENRDFAKTLVASGKTTAGAYDRLNAELAVLRKNIKDIKASGGVVPKADLDRLKELDVRLKTIDTSVGQSFRNIGNYRDALISIGDVVTGGLITGGISAIASSTVQEIERAIQTISEFEQSLAELSSITGLQGEQLDGLASRAIRLSNDFGTSAKDIVEGFGLVGSAIPELLQSGDALASITEQAIILSKASGLTLQQSIESLTKALNSYGADASRAAEFTDVLATSQQLGTARIDSLSDSLKNVGSVANAAGISFERTNVLLQALAKGGLEGAEAGTKLRNILLILAETGRNELNPATQSLNDILSILEDEVTDITAATQVFGRENAAAALTLIEQREVVENLTDALNQQGNALQQAITNTNTLEGSVAKFSSSYDSFILSLNQGNDRISGFFKKVVDDGRTLLDGFRLFNEGVINDFNEFILATGGPLQQRLAFIEELEERQRRLEATPQFGTQGRRGGQSTPQQDFDSASQALQNQRKRLLELREGTDEYDQALTDLSFLQERLADATKRLNNEQARDLLISERRGATLEELKQQLEQAEAARGRINETDKEGLRQNEALIRALRRRIESYKVLSDRESERQRDAEAAEGSVKMLADEVQRLNAELEKSSPSNQAEVAKELAAAEGDLEKARKALNELKDSFRDQTPRNEIQRLKEELKLLNKELETTPQSELEAKLLRIADTKKQLENAKSALEDLKNQIASPLPEQSLILSDETDLSAPDILEGDTRESSQSALDRRIKEIEKLKQLRLNSVVEEAESYEELAEKRKAIEQETEIEILELKLDSGLLEIDQEAAIQARIKELRLQNEDDTNSEILSKRASLTDQIVSFANQAAAKIFQIENDRINREEQRSIETTERRFDEQIRAAEGNEERQAELRQEREATIAQIEKEAAKRRKEAALKEAAIELALQAIKAAGNPLRLAAVLTLGALQIAAIEAQEFAAGGQVQPRKLGTGVVKGANIKPTSKGDNVLAYVRTGEVIMNKTQQKRLMALTSPEIFGMIGVPGFVDGGVVPGPSFAPPQGVIDSLASQQVTIVNVETRLSDEDIERIAQAIQSGAMEGTMQGAKRGTVDGAKLAIREQRRETLSTTGR